MASRAVTDSMDSQASRALLVMASKDPQGTQATQEHPAPRAFQEKGVPQDWASRVPRASVVSLEMLDSLECQASPDLRAPQASQDK